MAQSDSLFTKFGVLEEVTEGTTPAIARQDINISAVPDLSRPRNIARPDVLGGANPRRPRPLRILQEDGNLSFGSPMQYKNMLLMYEAALMSDIEAAVSLSLATISATAATGVIADSASGFGSIQNGDIVFIAGTQWTGAGNTADWYGPVTSTSAAAFTVPAAQVPNDVTIGASVTVDVRRLTDADTPRSFSIEEEFTKLTTEFRGGKGMKVQTMTWSWTQGSFVEESVTMIGRPPTSTTTTIGTGAATAAPTLDFLNAVQDFGTIYIAEAKTSIIVTSWELVLNIELAPFYGLGSVGPSNITEARIMGQLNVGAIYDDNARSLLDNIEAFDSLALWWDVKDTAATANRIAFSLPATKASLGDIGGGGPNTPLEFRNLQFDLHDPVKDPGSAYVAAGFDQMIGIFFID